VLPADIYLSCMCVLPADIYLSCICVLPADVYLSCMCNVSSGVILVDLPLWFDVTSNVALVYLLFW
jgi:hypothetical protein